ncbi:MAG: hypothetical protein IJN91_01205 [Alphaproteobacteria bacterium]|nr:hypothetical protein [Alphaproteobacteria bacterium]
MKKVLISTILGLVVLDTAGASIISRGFFDEKIADYATLSDLTDLLDKVGETPPDLGLGDTFIAQELFSHGEYEEGPLVEGSIYDFIYNNFRNVDFPGLAGAVNKILYGFDNIDGSYKGIISLNETVQYLNYRIGAVPDGYTNLGDALAAVRVTADRALELAEQAIPDPRAEGGNGKFVLTVDVIGENTTYHWEKIDRTLDENQTEQ